MVPEVKAAWVAALRSGNYRQGNGTLHNIGQNTYCCLGVLCDLAVKAGVAKEREGDGMFASNVDSAMYHSGVLPKAVADWAGLSDCNPVLGDHMYHPDDHGPLPTCATTFNDSLGYKFNQIADLVEANL